VTSIHTDHLQPLQGLRRSADDRMVAGVAGGLAQTLGLDAGLVRVVLVGLALAGGIGIPLYVAAWLLLPADGESEAVADRLAGAVRDRRRAAEVPW